jgi:hypothetical protein
LKSGPSLITTPAEHVFGSCGVVVDTAAMMLTANANRRVREEDEYILGSVRDYGRLLREKEKYAKPGHGAVERSLINPTMQASYEAAISSRLRGSISS